MFGRRVTLNVPIGTPVSVGSDGSINVNYPTTPAPVAPVTPVAAPVQAPGVTPADVAQEVLRVLTQMAGLPGNTPAPVVAPALVAADPQAERYAIIARVRQEMGLVGNDHEDQRLAGMDNFSEGRVRVALQTIEHEKAAQAATRPTPTPTPAPPPAPIIDHTAVVEEIRREILGGRLITVEFCNHLQTLATEDEARAKLVEYKNTGEAIAQMDRDRGVAPFWQAINRLANEVVMGRMTLGQAKAKRQADTPTPRPAPTQTPNPAPGGATGATSVAAAGGLLTGMTGRGVK